MNAFLSRCAVAWFRLRRIDRAAKWRWGVAAIALVISILLKAFGLSDRLFVLVMVLLVIESVILALEFYHFSHASNHEIIAANAFSDYAEPLLNDAKIDFPTGYYPIKLRSGEWIIENKAFNTWLSGGAAHIPIEIKGPIEAHTISQLQHDTNDLIDYLAASINESPKRVLSNDKKIALLADPDIAMNKENAMVPIARTDYFTTFITNRASGQKLVRKKRVITQLFSDFSFLFPIAASGERWQFASLNQSNLSNHIGSSTLAFTNDGYVLLPLQARRSQKSEGKYAPTGSGSLDWADRKAAKHSQDLLDIIRFGAERELQEEQTLKRIDKKAQMQTMVIGYFRWLNYGGQPEFLCITKIDCALRELRPNPNELVDETHIVFDEQVIPSKITRAARTIDDVIRMCDELLATKDQSRLSVPLEVLLLELRRQLTLERIDITNPKPISVFLFDRASSK